MGSIDDAYLGFQNVIPFKLKGEIATQNRHSTIKPHSKMANHLSRGAFSIDKESAKSV